MKLKGLTVPQAILKYALIVLKYAFGTIKA